MLMTIKMTIARYSRYDTILTVDPPSLTHPELDDTASWRLRYPPLPTPHHTQLFSTYSSAAYNPLYLD